MDNGCASPDQTVTVNVEEGVEIISLTADPSGIIPQGNSVTLTVETNFTDNLIYDWSTGASTTTNSVSVETTEIPLEIYSVVVTDTYGCTDEASIEIEVTGPEYEIPNIFTPNGDGVNDSFGPVINGTNVQVIDFRIYNRWGEKVFENDGATITWDGNFKNEPAVSDVYAFIMTLELPDGERVQESGDVTLVR